jgi:uncharacterized OB-fold protein
MTNPTQKPLPRIDELTRPFWEAAHRHELFLQRCSQCGRFRYPPGNTCPDCLSDELEWTKASGRAKIYTWTVFHKVYHPGFAAEAPYAVVAVELEEGPRMTTNVTGLRPDELEIGMPVEVVFEEMSDEITLPRFRPV